MYYVLFSYKGKIGRGFERFRYESDVIKFIHEKFKEMEVERIIKVGKEYRLGLVVNEELIKSTLEPIEEENTEEEIEKEILQQNKAALQKADKALKRGRKDLEGKKKEWELCSRCHVNKVAPWNKKGVCSPCQHAKKSKGDGTSFLNE